MGSPRRPTYASPARREPAGRQPAAKTPPAGPDVISASKSAPVPSGTIHRRAEKGKNRGHVPPHGKRRLAAGNVLVFPEPPAKRRKRHILVALGTVLGAGRGAAGRCHLFSHPCRGHHLRNRDQAGHHGPGPAALEPLKGKPLPQVSDDEVGRLLEPLVQVKSVTTQARPPSELVVEVLERIPVALVKQGEQYKLVDVDGVVLATTADPASVSLPVIDGGAGTIGKDLFQATAEVLGALPPDVLSKLSNASAQSVDAVELKLVDGQTIIWGMRGRRSSRPKCSRPC